MHSFSSPPSFPALVSRARASSRARRSEESRLSARPVRGSLSGTCWPTIVIFSRARARGRPRLRASDRDTARVVASREPGGASIARGVVERREDADRVDGDLAVEGIVDGEGVRARDGEPRVRIVELDAEDGSDESDEEASWGEQPAHAANRAERRAIGGPGVLDLRERRRERGETGV